MKRIRKRRKRNKRPPKLISIDVDKFTDEYDHEDLVIGKQYLVKVENEWFAGKFRNFFKGWELVNPAGLSYHSSWGGIQEIYEIISPN